MSGVISGVAIDDVGLGVRVKYGDPRSNRARVMLPAHFVMDNERITTGHGASGVKQIVRRVAFGLNTHSLTFQTYMLTMNGCRTDDNTSFSVFTCSTCFSLTTSWFDFRLSHQSVR